MEIKLERTLWEPVLWGDVEEKVMAVPFESFVGSLLCKSSIL